MTQDPFDTVLNQALRESSLAHADAAHLEACSKAWKPLIADVRPHAFPQAKTNAWAAGVACAAVALMVGLSLGPHTNDKIIKETATAKAAPAATAAAAPVNCYISFTGDCGCDDVNPTRAELTGQGIVEKDVSWQIFAGAIGTAPASAPSLYSGAGEDATAQIVAMEAAGRTGDFTLRFRTPDPEGTAYYSRVFTIT